MQNEYEAMRRRNQMALALMQQNSANMNPNRGPWSALANMGNTLASAFMAKKFGDEEKTALEKSRESQRLALADVMAKVQGGDQFGAYQAAMNSPDADYGAMTNALLSSAAPKEKKTFTQGGIVYDMDTKEPLIPGSTPQQSFDIVQGLDENGQMAFFRVPKQGDPGIIPGMKPVPKNGFNVTTADGTTVSYGGTQLPVEKSNKGEWERQVGDAIVSLDRLEQITRDFKPEYLTLAGQIENKVNKGADYLGLATPEQKKAITERRRFTQNVNTEFNAYRKEITGAAAAIAELERLKDGMIADDLGPTEFASALETYKSERARIVRIRNKLMRDGVPSAGLGKALDQAFLTGADDDASARGAELEQRGMNDDQILQRLRIEGYIR